MAMSGAQQPPVHDLVKPLAWLLGKWSADAGHGHFPTIKDFTYGEVLQFDHVGQPSIQFSACAHHSETKKPMHREVGFIRPRAGSNDIAWICAQNTGITELAEGKLDGTKLTVESHTIGRITFGAEPRTLKISRSLQLLEDGRLQQQVSMATSTQPQLQEHLIINYSRVSE